MRSPLLILALCGLLVPAGFGQTDLLRSDSRAPYVHRISLYDHDGEVISPADGDGRPYSPMATCGKCHEVGKIARGWHFNANQTDADPGRPGEPWIYSDAALGVQIPISGRGWKGTFTPAQVGLSDWEFVKRFGAHTPGGGYGDPVQKATNTADTALPSDTGEDATERTAHRAVAHVGDDEKATASTERSVRWDISGAFEIDCMVCHSADETHDPAETARQIEQENDKWAPTAALGLGVVRGEARKLPDDFDPWMGPDPDRPDLTPPKVEYDGHRFDPDDRVFFNVTNRPSPDRCYFCHSFRQIGAGAAPAWRSDGDIHLRSGLICVDCHRNGIDHMISRDYDGDPATQAAPEAPLTCRGCHLGQADLPAGPDGKSGRLGAPYPEHKGIPLVHFDKLTCTACHSGPWPEDAAKRFQTAMNHGLGLPTRERTEDAPPTIVEPIFARNADGKIAPHRMIWSAYWGVLKDGEITPIPLKQVRAVFDGLPESIRDGGPVPSNHDSEHGQFERGGAEPERQGAGSELKRERPESEPEAQARSAPHMADGQHEAATSSQALSDVAIAAALADFSKQSNAGEAVYIRDGRLHRLVDGKLVAETNSAAQPYLWPIAHDVRPAAQSLGVRGCTDCHADGAPIDYGHLAAVDEPDAADRPIQTMHDLRGEDMETATVLNTMFRARTLFKVSGLICAGILGLVLVRHGLAGIGAGAEP